MSIWQKFDGTATTPATLSQACEAIVGRPVWSHETAHVHMDTELAKAPRQSLLWPMREVLDELYDFALIMLGLVTVVMATCCFIGVGVTALALMGLNASGVGASILRTIIFFGATIACGATTVGLFRFQGFKLRGPAQWKMQSLDLYLANGRYFPHAASLGVRAIAKALPSATFTVYELLQDTHPLDPVLEVEYFNPMTDKLEKAYPFVWDADGTILSPPASQP